MFFSLKNLKALLKILSDVYLILKELFKMFFIFGSEGLNYTTYRPGYRSIRFSPSNILCPVRMLIRPFLYLLA